MLTHLQQAAGDFAVTIQSIFINSVTFGSAKDDDRSNSFVIQGDLMEWYNYLAPLTSLYLLTCGNDLEIYPYSLLEERQKGYIWDELEPVLQKERSTPQSAQSSLQEWIVIADIGADPIVAHKKGKDTSVLVAAHGRGQWDFKIVAPTLTTFLKALNEWATVCFVQTNINMLDDVEEVLTHIYDEDCKYLKPVERRLRKRLSLLLNQEQLNNFLNFF